MSEPHPPYYYNIDRDTYHWELDCDKNYYPNPRWKKTETKPTGREQCNFCRAK